MGLEPFHFLRPWWLLALVPLLALVWIMVSRRLGSRGWQAWCDPGLLPYVLAGQARGRGRYIAAALTAVGGTLAILALAGPVWSKLPQPVFSSQSALVIALDLSRSMAADDISPSRVGRSRFKIRDLLEERREGRTALLVYAGDAFTVTPLTTDTQTIVSQLNAVTPDIMPVQGNRTDIALLQAMDLLQQAGAGVGHVLLITDAVDIERSRDEARRLNDAGYLVSVLGVGTEHGVPIPLSDGSYLKDDQGRIVIPTLEEEPLRELAGSGGGIYAKMQLDNTDIDRLMTLFSASVTEEMTATELQSDVWREQGPWLLLPLLPLAALAFRRGYLVLLLSLMLPYPDTARALEWSDLWLRHDQQAEQALASGDYEYAARLFRDPAWKGAAHYRAGEYADAVVSLEGLEDAEDLYNLGNALARGGHLMEAIKAYEQALALVPDHADAEYNKKVVEEALEQQQQQQQGGGEQQQNDRQGQDSQQQQQENQQGTAGRGEQQQGQRGDGRQQGQSRTDRNTGGDQRGRPGQEQESDAERNRPDESGQGQTERSRQAMLSDELPTDEEQQATEQWLRRIPDDPAGLLRRKFRYQYQQRQREHPRDAPSW